MRHDAHKGDDVPHTHDASGQSTPLPLNPDRAVHLDGAPPTPTMVAPDPSILSNPMVIEAQQRWFANEFVAGLIAVAQATGRPASDLLADACGKMSVRLSVAEAQVAFFQTQLQAIVMENQELHRQIDDCGCDENVKQDSVSTTNGDS